jgi:hypothetical protein
MKKILVALIALLSFSLMNDNIQAEEVTWEKTFVEDFESYNNGKVETQENFTSKWTNDGWSGTNPNPTDINDVATIRTENTNKFMNMTYASSFFYMAPTNFRANEFEVEFDFRSNDLTDAWIGVNMRKEYRDIRYNGGTGMMFYFKTIYIKNLEGDIIGESLLIQSLRGGSLSTTDLDSLLVGDRLIEYIYPEGEAIDPTKQIKSNWYNVKIKVTNTDNANESLYEIFINDVAMATLTYARASINVYGYFGLHSCTGDIDVDNFKIQSFDEVAPPPIVRVNQMIEPTGKVGDVFEVPGSDEKDLELIDDADGKVTIQVTLPNQEIITLDEGVYQFTPTIAGIHTLSYVAENQAGTKAQVDFLINVSEKDDPVDPDPVDPDPVDPDPDKPEEESNTGLIIGFSVAAVAIIGAGVFFFVSKKK